MTDRDNIEENEEEILDLNEKNVSKESMFHHKLRKKDKKIKNSESYNNNTIFYVVSMVALFVIWFTAFAQPLAYNNRLLLFNNDRDNNSRDNGNKDNNNPAADDSTPSRDSGSNTRKPENSMWNVGFVDMILSSKIGNSEEIDLPSFTKTKANFHVLLSEAGDEISYNIVIKNSGTIDAKVSNITINPLTDTNDPIFFVFSGLEVGDELDAGKSVTVNVNVKYNPNYSGSTDKITKDFAVFINYVQK